MSAAGSLGRGLIDTIPDPLGSPERSSGPAREPDAACVGSDGKAVDTALEGPTGASVGREREPNTAVTLDLARRLAELADDPAQAAEDRRRLRRASERLAACWPEDRERRCTQAICPRCALRVSKRNRRRLEARFRTAETSTRFYLATATVVAEGLRHARTVLSASLADLRRRVAWQRAFLGGEQHFEYSRTGGASCAWNVHAHLMVEGRAGVDVDVSALANAWTVLVERRGCYGSLDVRLVTHMWGRGDGE